MFQIKSNQPKDGKELRWRIREWGFDPFTVIEPVVSEPEVRGDHGNSCKSRKLGRLIFTQQGTFSSFNMAIIIIISVDITQYKSMMSIYFVPARH